MGFLRCFIYLSITGISAFFAGRIVPKRWFNAKRFPYKCYKFERDGRIYEKLRIRFWQNKLPDMSRILPKFMPAKSLKGNYRQKLERMVQETCVAELVHLVLCFTGLYSLKLWRGIGGAVVALLHAVFLNLPFIVIQRYNRPRLIRVMEKQRNREMREVCVF